jgi:hypothetical protein
MWVAGTKDLLAVAGTPLTFLKLFNANFFRAFWSASFRGTGLAPPVLFLAVCCGTENGCASVCMPHPALCAVFHTGESCLNRKSHAKMDCSKQSSVKQRATCSLLHAPYCLQGATGRCALRIRCLAEKPSIHYTIQGFRKQKHETVVCEHQSRCSVRFGSGALERSR